MSDKVPTFKIGDSVRPLGTITNQQYGIADKLGVITGFRGHDVFGNERFLVDFLDNKTPSGIISASQLRHA